MATADELFVLGVAAHQTGDLDAAERYYRQLVSAAPDHAPALSNLASLVARRGRTDEAEHLYARAVVANPDFLDARFNRGNLLRRAGRFAEAAAEYAEVLRRAPDHPHALLNLGLAAGDAGDWPRAAECFARSAALTPDRPDPLLLLGDARARLGLGAEALAAFREAARRFPDAPRAHYNCGLQLAAAGDPAAARAALERALELNPDYAEAHNALGAVLDAAGDAAGALARYREALRLRPDLADALANLGANLAEQGLALEAQGALRRALALAPNPVAHGTLLALLPYMSAAEHLADETRAWAAAHAGALFPARPPAKRPPAPRLRVGYVCGDPRARHTVALLEALLARHDRTRVHVSVYAGSLRPTVPLDRLRPLADVWRDTTGATDERVAAAVRADGIDVAVDLTGHAPGGRLLALARKPAPVQVALLGEPVPTGLHAIDYRVSDLTADPPDAPAPGGERLVRLPDVRWPYVPPADAPAPNVRAAPGPLAFGCLDHPAKVSTPCLYAWAEVLGAVPGARLVLRAGPSGEARAHLAARCASCGIGPERLDLLTPAAAAELTAYHHIDVALDPFPCGGAAAACDALWMGVPVLTVRGPDARGRQVASVLEALGVPEFVAEARDQLAPLAATWAGGRAARADLRAALRGLMRESPVTDVEAYVRHLEAVYQAL